MLFANCTETRRKEPAVKKAPKSSAALQPFPQCPALDGCHCVTNSLAKIFNHARHPLSEEMLLGLGAGIGFIYWQMNFAGETSIFIGGRGNMKHFYQDLADRTGVRIAQMHTGSAKRAEDTLLTSLRNGQPVMLGGDMGFLPWLNLPAGYHFGGHTFVACGFDGAQTVLCSDMEPKSSGIKKGLYAPITLQQLRLARSSPHKPFPPQNLWLEFDFSRFRMPAASSIRTAIAQAAEAHLRPPIKNMGVSGMRHSAIQLPRWCTLFNDFELRMNLFNLYVFIEIGGTGGGAFRAIYARFLREASTLARLPALAEAADEFSESARLFSAIGQLFKDAETAVNLEDKIRSAADSFRQVADLEEQAWNRLLNIV